MLDRRQFVLLASTVTPLAFSAPRADPFSFVHFTETHITDEYGAVSGCEMCFNRIHELGSDFAIAGGDLVYDVCAQNSRRAVQLFELYRKAERRIGMPVHHVIGNHDVYGLFKESGVAKDDPRFGKRLFQDYIGPRYSSFRHKGWLFLLIDSIGVTADRQYCGLVDAEQMAWISKELASVGPKVPVIVVTHMPVCTAYLHYGSLTNILAPEALVVTNAHELLDLLAGYNIVAVLQGHLHVREVVDNAKGCRYFTSGAVCGNWWRGARDGYAEGFSRFTISSGHLTCEYYGYGFHASARSKDAPGIVNQTR